jgi:putative ATP-binding cassette transporter
MLQAPRLFAHAIDLGDMRQSAQAFGKIMSGLSFFRNAFSQLASYDAVMIRLDGLLEASRRARELPSLTTQASVDGSVVLDGVEVRTPSGQPLINPIDLRLGRSESMVVTGASGTGKTTLLRGLAEIWAAATGSWSVPPGEGQTMFVSQLLYVPLGDLRTIVSYPAGAGDFDDDRLRSVLDLVFLPHLRDRLDEELDWAKILSPGEQQRIAFARVLLAQPKAVFLDEATSALDDGLQLALYELLRSRLPDTIVVSVSHQAAVVQQHEHRLELLGAGEWRFSPVGSP